MNLAILFTSALLRFPTAVVSYAVQSGTASDDARTAVALYALVGWLRCASWSPFRVPGDTLTAARGRGRRPVLSARVPACRFGSALYLLGGVAGYVVTPLIALVVFFLIPAFYGITSHGLAELHDAVRRRTLVRLRRPGALP